MLYEAILEATPPRPIPAATELACSSAAGDTMRNAMSRFLALFLVIILAFLALQNCPWPVSCPQDSF